MKHTHQDNANDKHYIGIDLCKAYLDIDSGIQELSGRIDNNEQAITAWAKKLLSLSHLLSPSHIQVAFEPTGSCNAVVQKVLHQYADSFYVGRCETDPALCQKHGQKSQD